MFDDIKAQKINQHLKIDSGLHFGRGKPPPTPASENSIFHNVEKTSSRGGGELQLFRNFNV